MSSRDSQRRYLNALGIDVWVPRETKPASDMPAASAACAESPLPYEDGSNRVAVDELDWEALKQRVASCTACALHTSRTQTVFGVGAQDADWMLIGEAPGAEEDRQGEPFVGRAGQLLNAMLIAIGLRREQVYIANVLKCRPPNNRDPEAQEVACCEVYLQRQVRLLRPKIIIALGRIAAQNLLKTATPLSRLRGHTHDFQGIPLVVTYHPAYLLRAPTEKRKAWEDLLFARAVADAPAAGKL